MPDFEPKNPDYAAMVAASFGRQGLMRELGIAMTDLRPGVCVLEAAAEPRLLQQHGYVHGALVGAALDCAGGYAAYSLMPAGSEVLTTEYKINFVAAAEGERLIARGRVVKPGRTVTVCSVEGYIRERDRETLIAVMLQSLIRIPAR